MDLRQDRRLGGERRTATAATAVHPDRRTHAGRRRGDALAHRPVHAAVESPPGLAAESSESADDAVRKIAAAFGVAPETLTAIENDDFVDAGPMHEAGPADVPPIEAGEALPATSEEIERYRAQIGNLIDSLKRRPQ